MRLLWIGPQITAHRFSTGLGADPVEVLGLRHGVLDLPNRPVTPFWTERGLPRPISADEGASRRRPFPRG
jgi:hypothetical protein